MEDRPQRKATWRGMAASYLAHQRLSAFLSFATLALPAIFFLFFPTGNDITPFIAVLVLVVLVVYQLALQGLLLPRRVARIRYLLREKDIHLKSGYLFRSTTSVSINRIQHLEVKQGPLERKFGLARLNIYTAGSMDSDLNIPGLRYTRAQALKRVILRAIIREKQVAEHG